MTDAKAQKCPCYKCVKIRDAAEIARTGLLPFSYMIVCEHCGNKRCPHAADHIFACTNSNEPNQIGVDVAAQGNPVVSADAMFRAMAKTAEQFCIERDEARAVIEQATARYNQLYDMWMADHRRMVDRGNDVLARDAEIAELRERVAKLTQERDWLGGKLHRCRNVMQANDPGNYREIFSDTALTGAAQGGEK